MHNQESEFDLVDDVKYTYSSEWISELETEEHWRLYWQQQKLMKEYIKEGDTVLEIGIGTSFTANYLKSKKINVTTMDIDKVKEPDIVGNIVNFDWEDLQFDHILGYEVFEHIPFSEFAKILSDLQKVCKKNLFISLPLNEKVLIELEYKLPKFKKRNFRLPIKKKQDNHRQPFLGSWIQRVL